MRVRVDAVGDDTALAGIQRLVAEAAGVQVPGPGPGRPGRRPALLRRPGRRRRDVRGLGRLGRRRRRLRAHRHRAGHRLPPRPRPGHPAGDQPVDRDRRPGPASSSRTAWRWSGCGPSTPCSSTRPAPSPRGRTWSPAWRRRRASTRTGAAPGRRRRGRLRAPAGPGHRGGGGASGPRCAGDRVPVHARPRRGGHRRRRCAWPSAGRRCCASCGLTSPSELAPQSRSGPTGAPPCSTSSATARSSARLALEDEIRPESTAAVDELHRLGIRVVMITGDARQVAEAVGAAARRRRGLRRGPARGQGDARWPSSRAGA